MFVCYVKSFNLMQNRYNYVLVRQGRKLFSKDSLRYPSEISLNELISGVQNNPVLKKRPDVLKNKYYGLRHGESQANVQGIISSDPVIGSTIHGLTSSGKLQARRAATSLIELVGRENICKLIFLSSNFTRARETAAECVVAVQNILNFECCDIETSGVEDLLSGIRELRVQIVPGLRERSFGELDGTVLINYNRVWPIDTIDAYNIRQGVESVAAVIDRAESLINEMEARYSDKVIVLTSHADTLQIFQTYLAGADPRTFSQYRFRNGEVRDMERLPTAVPLTYR